MTDAHIKSRELKVYFADRKLGFEVNCKDSNPVQSFPKLCFSKKAPASTANVTCLLTAMPTPTQPCEPISLHRGLNFVTVCLMPAASLVGPPYFSASGDLWLEGNQILPGVNTVSGPMNFSGLRFPATQNVGPVAPFPRLARKQVVCWLRFLRVLTVSPIFNRVKTIFTPLLSYTPHESPPRCL